MSWWATFWWPTPLQHKGVDKAAENLMQLACFQRTIAPACPCTPSSCEGSRTEAAAMLHPRKT